MRKVTPEVINTIETSLDNCLPLSIGFWDEKKQDFIPLTLESAKEYGMSENIVDPLMMFSDNINVCLNAINKDLKQLGAEILK